MEGKASHQLLAKVPPHVRAAISGFLMKSRAEYEKLAAA
jgi:hypothetical protein